MKKFLLIGYFLFLFFATVSAQQAFKLITLPSLDSTTERTAFIRTPDNGFLIGTRQSGVTGWGSTMIKLDSAGNPVFAKQLTENISKIILCSDGGFLMLGTALIKTDSALNILWAKKITQQFSTFTYSSMIEKDGNIFLAGSVVNISIDASLGFYPTYVAIIFKLDSVGSLTNTRILADTVFSSSRYNLYFPTLVVSGDGNLYMSLSMLQYWAAGTCNRQPTIIKLDTALNVLWSNIYRANIFNNVTGLSVLKDGNIALYGDYGNNYPYCTYFNHYLQKIDTAGTLIFAKDYHHTFRASHGTGGMIEMEDSSLLFTMAFIDTIAGHTVPYFNHLSENGQLLNSTAFDIPYGHYSFALNISNEFNDLIPVCRLNDWDTILFMNIDTSLTAICGTVPNAMVDSDLVITPELFNSVYLPYTFTFHDTLFPAFQQVPIQYTDGCSGNSIAESRSGKPLTLFPNPTSGKLRIRNAPFEINEISLYNLPGSLVYSWKYTGTKKEIAIDISDLAPGVYIYKVSGRDNERRGKIVKE